MGAIPALIAAGGVCAASGVFAWAAVAPSSQLFGRTVRRTGDRTTLALTFDDGPNPAVTPQILDLLHQHGARATFFLMGQHVRAFPALAKEIAARGHIIGNHTETHPRLVFYSAAQIRSEIELCNRAIGDATGLRPLWMRPPFGFRGPALDSAVRSIGATRVVMWSASAGDWRRGTADRVIERLRRAGGGDIVLLHDGDFRVLEGDRRRTVSALEYWLPRWKDAGLRFVTLDEVGRAKKAAD